MSIDPQSLRLIMRRWGTGVTVVSAIFGDKRHGMTVSSFTSLSLSPPLVLVSLERETTTRQMVTRSGHFGVSFLSQGQQAISDRFAGRQSENQDRFAGLQTYTLTSGVPLLAGSLAGLDCRVVATYEAGTHTVFTGEVLAAQPGVEAPPLLYYDRAYRRFGSDEQ